MTEPAHVLWAVREAAVTVAPEYAGHARQLEALLRDLLPHEPALVTALVLAARLGVPAAFASLDALDAATAARLSQELSRVTGLTGAAAEQAVCTWAEALGLALPPPLHAGLVPDLEARTVPSARAVAPRLVVTQVIDVGPAAVTALAVSADGRGLAVTFGTSGTRTYDATTGWRLRDLPPSTSAGLTMDRDGHLVAGLAEDTLWVAEMSGKAQPRRFTLRGGLVAAAFLGSGEAIALASRVDETLVLELEPPRVDPASIGATPGRVAALGAFEQSILYATSGGLVLARGRIVTARLRSTQVPGQITAMAVARQRALLTTADGGVHHVTWEESSAPLPVETVEGGAPAAVSGTGARAALLRHGVVTLVTLPGGDLLAVVDLEGRTASALAFGEGDRLVVGTSDGAVLVAGE